MGPQTQTQWQWWGGVGHPGSSESLCPTKTPNQAPKAIDGVGEKRGWGLGVGCGWGKGPPWRGRTVMKEKNRRKALP